MGKIKVVWICNFSNNDVRSILPLSGFWLINRIRNLFFGRNSIQYNDFAPWVTALIKEFEQFDDVELHVIAPHIGLKKIWFEFEKNSVYYHFFKPDCPLMADRVFNKLFKRKNRQFRLNRFFVKRFLKNIKPDIVNLFGAENPYYSITALDIKDIPVYVLLQTMLATPYRDKYNFVVDSLRLEVEKKTILKHKYFGTASKMYRDCVVTSNPDAKVLEFWFPTQKPPSTTDQLIEFDFVFYSTNLSEIKGIEDAIDALSVVSRTHSKAKMNVIGSCVPAYKLFLESKIAKLGLTENIVFSRYFPKHEDMFTQVKKAKIALLPCKLDVISSTIREAMFLGIPVVTYKTTGTPWLNKEKHCVLISEIGDIEDLANNMIKLIKSPELAQSLVSNAKSLANKIFDNAAIASKLLADNKAILLNYHNKAPIPHTLTFNTDAYPEY